LLKKLVALALLFSSTCQAGEVFLSYGVGIFGSADHFTGQVKMANIGYRTFIANGIYWQFKAGAWGDGSSEPDRHGSVYISTGPGMEIDLRPFEFRSGWSLATISTPDSYLGGRFPQFNGEAYWGVRDKNGNGAGVQYEHVSCLTFCSPNLGRDFGVLQLSHKW